MCRPGHYSLYLLCSQERERKTHSSFSLSLQQPLILYKHWDSSRRGTGGATCSLLSSPLHRLRMKTTFLFPPNFTFLSSFSGQRKPRFWPVTPPSGRIWERSKGERRSQPRSQNPPRWNQSWLRDAHATRKDPESEWLARDNLETNPITIKPDVWATWQSSSPGFPYPAALCPGSVSQ